MDRNKNLKRVRDRDEPWDVVVIGGGATGVGCALDAATRGLEVLLVEQNDLGWGTSSRSTKLVHGGVRYLRQGDISLVREALRERGLLLRNAPHVVHTKEFIVPCYSTFQKIFYGIGLKIYDLLAGKYSLGRSRILSREETVRKLPTVNREGLRGGVLYIDGQFDDTRLLIDMAVTTSRYGACLINYVRVDALRKKDDGSTTSLILLDTISDETFEVQAKTVINATGAFCDQIRKMSDAAAKTVVTFARGSHIVLDRKFLPGEAAIMIPKTSDGRVLFCIPWLGHLLVGTTDEPCETVEQGMLPSDDEIDFLLETAGEYLTTKPTRQDILSKFAGVRPLVSRAGTTNTANLSRGHELFIADGLVTITGGKWTTYRQMAEQAVDAAITIGKLDATECVTKGLKIDAPPPTHGELLHPDLPYTREDIIRAVSDEMACTVEDVLARRTRATFLNEAAAEGQRVLTEGVIARERGRNF